MKLLLVVIMAMIGWSCWAGASGIGDVVTNAPTKLICVTGEEVAHPGHFRYEDGMTVSKAIKLAGGFTKWARKNKIQLIRAGELSARDVNLSQIEMRKTNDLKIRPGDYVLVEQARTLNHGHR
jgi:polysaccharide export outer membrane protein